MAKTSTRKSRAVTSSSTAEYFSKNLQQVGFSSPTKAVLTTLKEAVDNALDACEDAGMPPDIHVEIEKLGNGSLKNTDKIRLLVSDNGPGIDIKDVPRVFGEYLASSKFGRGRCSRGQQGIGISAATTWAMQTTATGARVITKTAKQRKATECRVVIDLKNNKGILKTKDAVDWDRKSGTLVEFIFDGRIQLNGEAGVINYLRGNVLVNPHLKLSYKLLDRDVETIERVSKDVPAAPDATAPHPHTMKLGEFISHRRLFGQVTVRKFLREGFSRVSDSILKELPKLGGFKSAIYNQPLSKAKDEDIRGIYKALQSADLRPPATNTVMSIGEETLAQSIQRLGDIDFFSVVTRKPTICDFKPVQIEVAVARVSGKSSDGDDQAQVLRFANRVPLQFDKAGCAIVKAINSVNWKTYGLRQSRGSIPYGPYIVAVSVVSPFIKFKNASKETIDASDELVEEIRRALMKCGQKLSRHLKREHKEAELEEKIKYIEKFSPILVEMLCRITGAPKKRKEAAEKGIEKILGRDTKDAAKQLSTAEQRLQELKAKSAGRMQKFKDEDADYAPAEEEVDESVEAAEGEEQVEEVKASKKGKTKKSKAKKATKAKASTKKKSKPAKKTAKKKVVKKKAVKKKAAKKTKTKKKAAKKKKR